MDCRANVNNSINCREYVSREYVPQGQLKANIIFGAYAYVV